MFRKLTLEQLQGMEADPTVAYKLLTKSKILGVDNYEVDMKGDPSVEFIRSKLWSALPQRPSDSKEAREFFLAEVPALWEKLQGIKDVEEGRVIIKEFMGIKGGSYTSYSQDRTIKELFGTRSRNALKWICWGSLGQDDFSWLTQKDEGEDGAGNKKEVDIFKKADATREHLTALKRTGGRDIGNADPKKLIEE